MECSVYSRPDGIVLDLFETQEDPVIAARRAAVYNVENNFVEQSDDEQLPSDAGTHHQISLAAIASFSELLGNGTDYDKTVREIMFIREHGEPEPDPVTGENAWTSAYEELDADINCIPMIVPMSNDLIGIAKTRSMLGLPALGEEVSAMSLDSDPAGIASYSVDPVTSSTIASFANEIEECRARFRDDLKQPTFKDMKLHDGFVASEESPEVAGDIG